MTCGWCDEPIDVANAIGEAAGDTPAVGFHSECLMRTFNGSVGHQLKICSCYIPGSDEGDPAGLTKRQAARAALRLYNHLHARELTNVNE